MALWTILRGLHVASGELGALLLVWAIIEIAMGPLGRGAYRAKIASLSGLVVILAHWVISGVYYVEHYGDVVKPVIKAGNWAWAHSIIMESKEHIFLFLPFIAALFVFLVWKHNDDLKENKKIRYALFALGGAAVIIIGLMIASGFLISSSYRA
jgi:hypothetical protein